MQRRGFERDPSQVASIAGRSTVLDGPPGSRPFDPKAVRDLAVRSLYEELVTYPKPGLVSPVDRGSHPDMDARLFVRSLFSLRRYFETVAAAGSAGADFPTLRRLGVDAETRMLRATGGVNTHRGAVFHLGLLAAAAGLRSTAPAAYPGTLGDIVRRAWGPALAVHRRDPASHGSRAGSRHRSGGALGEALAGFPSVFESALPAYRAVLAGGGSAGQARVQAFFELLARIDDTNLLHRGGPEGLAYARRVARDFLARGGVSAPRWRTTAGVAHRGFCERRLGPGGSADLLAACIFVHSLAA